MTTEELVRKEIGDGSRRLKKKRQKNAMPILVDERQRLKWANKCCYVPRT
jgi:hypothetical protein